MIIEKKEMCKSFRERDLNIDDLVIEEEEYERVKGKKLKIILDNLYYLFYTKDENVKSEEIELIRLLFGLKYHIEKDKNEVLKYMILNGYSFEMVTKIVEIFINYL
ncbi:hypothetical protein NGRA_1550 [Nosema granulosis]|uniref:Uncharacterized protein n=1 Tax=Nosema granulosis TaxID=83296 RepID=A0A9P6GZA4_9MICR|nr:hypothetical protein NGRA_1550 [Nosema granulosis]